MKERPILFNAPMVRAVLAGTKTQTRRLCKPAEANALCEIVGPFDDETGTCWFGDAEGDVKFSCPYGQPGDRLWVREAFQPTFAAGVEYGDANWETGVGYAISYPATDGVKEWIDGDDNITSRCKPSIHMPRWASRITLEIVSVRVERLQDISEADAKAEGIETVRVSETDFRYVNYLRADRAQYPKEASCGRATLSYATLWESINGPGSWAANPWAWVVEFRRVQP